MCMEMLTGYGAGVSVTMSAEMNTFLETQKLVKHLSQTDL